MLSVAITASFQTHNQVEGEELEVLRGLDEASWSRIQQVAVEVHDCIDGELIAVLTWGWCGGA